MNRIFNLDNKFFTSMNKIVDVFWLNLIFVISCIPIFTIGAACSAAYYTIHKQIMHNRGYVWENYKKAFISNFKNSTPTWLVQLVLTILFAYDLYLTRQFLAASSKWGILYYLFLVLVFFVWVWGTFCYGYFARFDQTRKNGWKNSLIIMIANLFWSILLGILLLITGIAVYIIPIGIMIFPMLFAIVAYLILERILHKYMLPEDIAREEEDFRNEIGH